MSRYARLPNRLTKLIRRERPVVAPTLGGRLQTLRGARSRGAICEQLLALGITLDRSTLLQYERGTVGSPDPLALWGLGRVYYVSVDDLLRDLVRDRTGRAAPPDSLARTPVVDSDQQQIAQDFDSLDPDRRALARTLMAALAARQREQHPAPPTPKKFKAAHTNHRA